MLSTAGFEVLEEVRPEVYPWGTEYIARPLPGHPSLPPTDYYRLRGERLSEGQVLPFDGYYDRGPDATASADDGLPRAEGGPEPDPIKPRFRRWRR